MKLYCSVCGIELTYHRQAVPGKGYILDVVDPHVCEGYAIGNNEDGKPTVMEILESLKPVGSVKVVSDGKNEEGRYAEPGDRRGEDSKVTSTAPGGLLRSMRDIPPSDDGDME